MDIYVVFYINERGGNNPCQYDVRNVLGMVPTTLDKVNAVYDAFRMKNLHLFGDYNQPQMMMIVRHADTEFLQSEANHGNK